MKKIIFLAIVSAMLLSCGKLSKPVQKNDKINTDTVEVQKKVKDFMDEAMAKNYKVEALEDGIYMIDFPLAYEDETRFQRVYLRDWYDERNKKQTYFINSYICDYTGKFDLAGMLREAEYGRISMICLKPIPDGKGGEKEAFYTQTTVPVNYINGNYDEFMSVVFEVAANADYLGKKFNKQYDLE